MALFQRLFFAVLLAGLISGAAMAALQQWRVVPLIIAAEAYEGTEAPAAHSHEAGTPAHDDTAAAAPAHEHGDDEWMPADGLERTFYTVASGLFAALGFAVFQFAPAFGLPPELPGMPAADVVARQIWWWGTAAATATAIYGMAKFQNIAAVAAGIMLIVVPHIIGAPQPADHASSVPAPLAAAFAANTLVVGLSFWLILAPLYGALVARFSRSASTVAVTA